MNAISYLWNGRPGLAKTYWLWGVLSGIPWGIALSLVTPGSNLAILVLLAIFAYYVIVHVGIWRAASEYEGAKTWAILAKIAVAITPVCLVIGTLTAVSIPSTHQSPKNAQSMPTTNSSAVDDKPISNPEKSNQQDISKVKEGLRKQGVGGNQDVFDVKSWGNDQLSARSFYGNDLAMAHAFAAMWQRQLIQKLRYPPERSLFIGYSIVLDHIDKDNILCRPDMSKNGGIETTKGIEGAEGDLFFKIHPECFKK